MLSHIYQYIKTSCKLQDILANDDIRLDWMFKYSLMVDLANVSTTVYVLHVDLQFYILRSLLEPR